MVQGEHLLSEEFLVWVLPSEEVEGVRVMDGLDIGDTGGRIRETIRCLP